jgi:hypothetical protein
MRECRISYGFYLINILEGDERPRLSPVRKSYQAVGETDDPTKLWEFAGLAFAEYSFE